MLGDYCTNTACKRCGRHEFASSFGQSLFVTMILAETITIKSVPASGNSNTLEAHTKTHALSFQPAVISLMPILFHPNT